MESTTERAGAPSRQAILDKLWTVPDRAKDRGAWLWWFWIFFIHDEDTEKSGKCRQLMILWSIKPEKDIRCNGLQLGDPNPVGGEAGRWTLQGAAAAWYFDGERVRENFVLEPSRMVLDAGARSLSAPGGRPSVFRQEGERFITTIQTPEGRFELVATQKDLHPANGPNDGRTCMPLGLEVQGTRIEIMELGGSEVGGDGKKKPVHGTAYFQKILLAAPPPQWYWGIYHFKDGSFFTYMNSYVGRAMMADNLWPAGTLRKPTLAVTQDVSLYHAPTGRFFEGHRLEVRPQKVQTPPGSPLCWTHHLRGGGADFEIEATAEAYAHALWSFKKPIGGFLPISSTFQYNEYPATLKRVVLTPKDGSGPIVLENGWGNMENAWGFIL